MKIGSAEFAKMFGDPDEDYDSFEKCVVRSIDALTALESHLGEFIFDMDQGTINASADQIGGLRDHRAKVTALRNALCEWGLGIPHHEVAKK